MFTQWVCRNLLLPIGVTAAVVFASATGAWADRGGHVTTDDDSVEVGVEIDDQTPGSSGSAGSGNGTATANTDEDGGSVPSGVCPNYEYELVDSDSGYFQGAFAGERPSEEHQLMGRSCTDPGSGSTLVGAEWVLVGEDGVPAVDPAVLAAQAVDSLRLPMPQIAASPEAAQLVRLPVWLWLEGASWSSQSASASVPGLTVTATAVPVEAAWDMGDGSTVTCEGPGAAWEQGMDPEASSPDCGHTYTRPSGGPLKASVTVAWEVTWSGGGQSGSVLGMVTAASVTWPVVESHALVTG